MSNQHHDQPTRRELLTAACAGLIAAAVPSSVRAQSGPSGRTFVLVHGAWHGGWCWRRVADRLRAMGHTVHAPTLTGLGERSHLMSPAITLETHVNDIVNVIKWEDASDVVLCGHSYGGFVISGVVERVPAAVRSLVFVDALVPRDGQNGLDVATPMGRDGLNQALKNGAISRPAPSAAVLNVNENDRAWVDGKMTPQPVRVSLDPIRLTGARERIARRAYVRSRNYADPTFDKYFEEAAAAGWRTYSVASGHDVMVDAPDRLTEILLDVA